MNITKAAKLNETESFELEYNGEKVKFEAKAASLTPRLLSQTSAISGYAKAVAEVVTDWDVTSDDNGTKWPLTEADLEMLPVNFLDAVLGKVAESWGGDKKKPQASASGSAAAAS